MDENVKNIADKSMKSLFWNIFGDHWTKLETNESINKISIFVFIWWIACVNIFKIW